MVLVDTSVWVDHFRSDNVRLRSLLKDNGVLTHPFVIGELACGWLRRRGETLSLLRQLPTAAMAEHDEVLRFVDTARLYGSGIGWIDAHLLAAARLEGVAIWSLDRRVARAAARLGIA